ncbi:MAG: TetR/AcrR family transcriptional regulator [Acidimicrobiia bacterium]
MAGAETESPRDRVLRVAGELFYEHGFHAVGIDLILERAEVAKATLYRHFPTKDDLIATYLGDANRRFWSWFDAAVDPVLDPADALAGAFDAVATLATSPVCLGCTFQVTAAEFPDPAHPGHTVALDHKRAVRTRLRELAVAAEAIRPDELADGLLLLMDGAFAAARMYGPDNPGRQVAPAARALIAAHTIAPPAA